MTGLAGQSSYAGVALALIGRGIGVPIPEDIPLLTAGYLCAKGVCDLRWMLPLAWASVLVSDSLSLCAGRFFRGQLPRLPVIRWVLAPHRIQKAERFYERHGLKGLLAARFMPGFRTPLFFAAGTAGMPYLRFLAIDAGASMVSVCAMVFLGWFFPSRLVRLKDLLGAGQWGALVLTVAALGVLWGVRMRKGKRSRTRPGLGKPPYSNDSEGR